MTEEDKSISEFSLVPDSVSENEGSCEAQGPCDRSTLTLSGRQPDTSDSNIIAVPVTRVPVTTTTLTSNYAGPSHSTVPVTSESSALINCPITPVISLSTDFQLSGSSTSAFRPFVTQVVSLTETQTDAQNSLSSTREITSSTELPDPITSTPIRRIERTTRHLSHDVPSKMMPSPSDAGSIHQSPTDDNAARFLNSACNNML